ncbi:MAG: GrpB family protein [Candidatus Falkowbacteria bacterium]
MPKTKIIKYQKDFVKIFKSEKEKLKKILNKDTRIEHFGSTAIPGTVGKGIIDIMAIFKNEKDRNDAVSSMKKTGYHVGDRKTSRGNRIFFSSTPKESRPKDKHIHLVIKGTKEHVEPILFRDFLLKNKEYIDQYNLLKDRLSKQYSREEYTQSKTDFVKDIIKKAKKTADKTSGRETNKNITIKI